MGPEILYRIKEEVDYVTIAIGIRSFAIVNTAAFLVSIDEVEARPAGREIEICWVNDGEIEEILDSVKTPIEAAHSLVTYWFERKRLPEIRKDREALERRNKRKNVEKPTVKKRGKFTFK